MPLFKLDRPLWRWTLAGCSDGQQKDKKSVGQRGDLDEPGGRAEERVLTRSCAPLGVGQIDPTLLQAALLCSRLPLS